MVNERKPIVLLPFPRPEHLFFSHAYEVEDGDSWESIATDYRIAVKTLIAYNFGTDDPVEVNWCLRENVGCSKPGPQGFNYRFSSADVPGIIYIPKQYQSSKGPRKSTRPRASRVAPKPCANDFSKSYEIELKGALATKHKSIDVADRFVRTVGAVGRTGRFIPTIIDTKYWFAKLYQIITAFEINAARDYKEPGFVLHFIPIFYDMYKSALDAWDNGGAGVSAVWSNHFKETGRPDNDSILGWSSGVATSIVTGVSAHINGDMGKALETAYRSYTKKYCLDPAPPFDTYAEDFFAMGAVFEQGRMAALSMVSSLGPVPEAAVKLGEAMGMGLNVSVVGVWRTAAWADAKRRLGQ